MIIPQLAVCNWWRLMSVYGKRIAKVMHDCDLNHQLPPVARKKYIFQLVGKNFLVCLVPSILLWT